MNPDPQTPPAIDLSVFAQEAAKLLDGVYDGNVSALVISFCGLIVAEMAVLKLRREAQQSVLGARGWRDTALLLFVSAAAGIKHALESVRPIEERDALLVLKGHQIVRANVGTDGIAMLLLADYVDGERLEERARNATSYSWVIASTVVYLLCAAIFALLSRPNQSAGVNLIVGLLVAIAPLLHWLYAYFALQRFSDWQVSSSLRQRAAEQAAQEQPSVTLFAAPGPHSP